MNHLGRNLGLVRRLTLVLILCLVRFPAAPAQQKIPELIKWVQHISSLEAEVQREPGDLRLRVQLAEAQIKIGRFAAAEATLKEALRLKPDFVPALVAIGDLYRRRFQFDEALKTSDRIVKLAPQDVPGRLLAAQLAEVRMDFTTARSIYKDVLQRNPKGSHARYGIARTDYWENRFDDAQQQLKVVLSDDPQFAKGWLLLSQIHQIRQQDRENATCIRKAVECDPLDDTVHAVYADLLMREKKPAEGYAESRLALQLNPYSAGTHMLQGMGWSLRVYPAPAAIPAGKEHSLAEALETGGSMLEARNLTRADEAFDLALRLMPGNIEALIGKGTVQYHKGNYDKALDQFFAALQIDGDYGLAHYGVSLCLLRKRDRFNVRFAEIERNFAAKDAPEPVGLRDVFTGYALLDSDLQKIIRLSVQPLRAWLPLLKERQVTFSIFPMHHFLWQVPKHDRLKGMRTFDGRLWDDVKGDGGPNASSGAEEVRNVKYLRCNILAHEFAHQVHGFLPIDLKDEIHRLYLEAMKTGKPLDFYAALNEKEYFAQGVEAYVSGEKLADQKVTSGHTRRELQRRDSELFSFIQKLDARQGQNGPAQKKWRDLDSKSRRIWQFDPRCLISAKPDIWIMSFIATWFYER